MTQSVTRADVPRETLDMIDQQGLLTALRRTVDDRRRAFAYSSPYGRRKSIDGTATSSREDLLSPWHLAPLALSERSGERHCEKCQPRPHRVLLTFQQHNVWDLSFLKPDCRMVVGRHFDVPSDTELFELAERGGADVSEIRQSIARWNKGST